MTCRMENGVTYKQSYNAENRLSSVQQIASGTCASPTTFSAQWDFAYDGDGTRVSQLYTPYDANGNPQTPVLTVYFMGGAYEVTGSVVRKYYAIAGMTVAMRDGSGLKYLLTDHLGSVVGVTDSSGTLISQQRYLPFGQVRQDVGSISQTDFGYTGQRANSYIKLLDYKSRWYDAELGRFSSPDSIIPNPANPQDFNRYSYVNNSPINYNDPSGHQEVCAILGACPDYTGIEKAISLMVQVDRGGDDILVAAGIAVQSEWPDLVNLNKKYSGFGPAQLSRAQLDTSYGKPVPGSEQYGLGLKGEDPTNPSTAVTGMSRRIYQVVNACNFCSAEDKLIMAALAQNNGFTLASMRDIKSFYYNKTTGINWAQYFTDRTQTSDPIAKYRAEAAGGYIYDTHFMLLLYTNDLLELNNRGWNLPFGLQRSDIYRMRNKYLHLRIPNFDNVAKPV